MFQRVRTTRSKNNNHIKSIKNIKISKSGKSRSTHKLRLQAGGGLSQTGGGLSQAGGGLSQAGGGWPQVGGGLSQTGGGWPQAGDDVSELTASLKAALPANLQFVAVTSISAEKPDNQTTLDNYVTALEQQDELYDSAVKAIRNDLGLSSNTSNSSNSSNATASEDMSDKITKLAKDKIDYSFQYLTYIEKYLCFDNLSATKIAEIKTRPLIELLIKPEQVHNNFIRELASVCVVIKKNDALFTKLKDPVYRESYARVCMATSESNSYMLSLAQLRDGFFPSQKISDFRKMLAHEDVITSTFWYKFITECVEDVDVEKDKKEKNYGDRFHTVAARVFKAYKDNKDNKSSLRATALKTSMGMPAYFSVDDSHPFSKLMSSTIDGETVENIFANVTLEELQFIVHLVSTITAMDSDVRFTETPSSPEIASPAETTDQ